MNSQSKGLSMLGLAMKAGKVSSGEFATEQAVKSGSAYLVILAETASANTQKKFRNMCAYYKVPCILFGDKEQLGRAIGREYRSSLAVCEAHFAEKIAALLAEAYGLRPERSVDGCRKHENRRKRRKDHWKRKIQKIWK